MEVRCGKCNKLFRVSDDKITGTGIKFACTRCGEHVRITREDFEHDTLSRGTVSVLDLFEPKHTPPAAPLSPEASEPVARVTASPEHESQPFDFAAQATHENVSEEKAPLFVEPDHLTPASAAKTESAVEIKPETLMLVKPKAEPLVELQPEHRPEPKPEPLLVPQQQAGPTTEREIPPAPSIQPAVQRKEYVHPAAAPVSPAAERIVTEPIHSSRPSHSGRMYLVLFVTLIIAGLAAYGIYFYLQSPSPSLQMEKKSVNTITSIEGLQIVNPVGSMEANGDLLISGAIENATVKERALWYVLAIVNDAQGSEIAKIRFLNGKQIYTRRDYDILAGRGVNVQEFKAKSLQEKGVVIPPNGTVKFEVRYLQPSPGIASFHTQLLPFDPIQMNKEIAAELN